MPDLLENTIDAVLYLTLNRPEKRNALNFELIQFLKEALTRAAGNSELRAIVIRGAGKDFCSGADLVSLRKIAESSYEENLEDARHLADLLAKIRKIEIPVIAAVHGRALAGGCGLASACDLVIAAETARFGYPEVKIGFVPAIVMAYLRRIVSEKRAFELITQGNEFTAQTAADFGLVNKLCGADTFEADVEAYVSTYSKVSRSAVAMSKKLLYEIDNVNMDFSLELGCEINAKARMSDDCKTGIARFLEKKN